MTEESTIEISDQFIEKLKEKGYIINRLGYIYDCRPGGIFNNHNDFFDWAREILKR